MGAMRTRVWMLFMAIAAAAGSLAAAPAVAGADDDEEVTQIEQRIEAAREQLDAAARTLGKLHEQLWKLETQGPRSERPMLGILIEDSGGAQGLTLAGVTPGGGAEEAGLQAGDRLVAVADRRLDGGGPKPLHVLNEAIAPVRAGETVTLTYVRDGAEVEAEVVTQARGQFMGRKLQDKLAWLEGVESDHFLRALEGLEGLKLLEGVDLSHFQSHVMRVPSGLRLEDVGPELGAYFGVERGALVLRAPDRDEDAERGLLPGDILLSVGATPVENSRGALEALAAAGDEVDVRVRRQGSERDVTVDAAGLAEVQAIQVLKGPRNIRIERDEDGEQLRLEITVDE